ncbi:TcfC E-set like domain-containing protein [Pectobacterium brasiliense]|uniref:TcfC E-set like domain-containing protein n=1 Tax=Pectobacterium brasiliense TaxID=180957 RepID=UPI001CF155B0|nr:TcfC E-set like domain-containing protein [Pectobacterium brasiliense]MCA6982399.1 TcfC E-set like domain-containing protein [Pectobacterium brasiliense]
MMNKNITISIVICGVIVAAGISTSNASNSVHVPVGFEDIFDARNNSIVDVIYSDHSITSLSVEYDRNEVLLASPDILVEKITAVDMPPLIFTSDVLLKKLSAPLKRINRQGTVGDRITVELDEANSTLRLVFPDSYFKSSKKTYDKVYIPHRSQAGFVHNHNVNYLSDSWDDSLSVSANETLNLTGNSYVKTSWSYTKDIDFSLDELALYLESQDLRYKAGRQRISDNFTSSTPSMAFSFFNSISFDGVSLGYLSDNYLDSGSGAASPVSLYLSQAGTVEVYRNGRLIDIQQFPAGLQYLDTRSWPSGGYNVVMVSRLANGVREEKVQPFFKRNGMFRSGDVEFLIQGGRYDAYRGKFYSRYSSKNCDHCNVWKQDIGNNHFVSTTLGYTTESALTLGGGWLMDGYQHYANTSLDIPINSWIAERLYLDGIYSTNGSSGYQAGISKNFSQLGLNLSYRENRFRGDRQDFRRFGIVPTYDYNYLQLSGSTFLPWNIGLGVSYGMNTLYQEYGRQNKNTFETWDVNLSRDFGLLDNMNLRVDLGYYRGVNTITHNQPRRVNSEDRVFAQFSLGMRERSYNHYQSLYLRSRLSSGGNNLYGANYALNLDNPSFDQGGKYSLNAGVNSDSSRESSGSLGVTMNNRLGHSAAGISRSFGKNSYQQYYLSQRGGFVAGDGDIAWSQGDTSSALIIDATALPEGDFFETRNRNTQSVVVKGGKKTVLAIDSYKKIDPNVEQLFTGKTNTFYNLDVKAPSTWAMPGQVYRVNVSATRNQTVTGRLYVNGQPLINARVVGGNALSDEEGLFVGDFSLKTDERLTSLTVKKEGQNYVCPLLEQNVRVTQGIMQIREVNCEVQ